ncbi:hypothetical protein K227x_36700 [Rubripirellula lacrimiformis]|uniref:Uncharacterized protein n=1 Tax=Rubripirellula lacrimiformis TaxID=1930273 RepID=A0A517NDR0_9BACT|nr:hypothetical protein K227x_36700 [Rubripirellula lacrimiformis]
MATEYALNTQDGYIADPWLGRVAQPPVSSNQFQSSAERKLDVKDNVGASMEHICTLE